MNIKLPKDYYIRSDSMNIILVKTINGRDKIQGYYATLDGALQGFLNQVVRDSNTTSITTLRLELKALQEALTHVLHTSKMTSKSTEEVKE